MATNPKQESTPVVYKAGPVFRRIQAELTTAFMSQDRKAYDKCIAEIKALKALMSETVRMQCTQWDMATSGYSDATWLNGAERLVAKDPDKPRGRKAAVKVDPADLV